MKTKGGRGINFWLFCRDPPTSWPSLINLLKRGFLEIVERWALGEIADQDVDQDVEAEQHRFIVVIRSCDHFIIVIFLDLFQHYHHSLCEGSMYSGFNGIKLKLSLVILTWRHRRMGIFFRNISIVLFCSLALLEVWHCRPGQILIFQYNHFFSVLFFSKIASKFFFCTIFSKNLNILTFGFG